MQCFSACFSRLSRDKKITRKPAKQFSSEQIKEKRKKNAPFVGSNTPARKDLYFFKKRDYNQQVMNKNRLFT